MSDYLPSNSSAMAEWLQNFVAGLTLHAVDLGVDVADITPLSTARADLSTSITTCTTKKAAAQAAFEDKNTKQQSAVSLARAMVKKISASPNLTNTIREELGLPVYDGTRTPSAVGPEVPNMVLEPQPGRVIVHFGTLPENEGRNSKPSWATGCVIYRRVNSETESRIVGFQKSSPFVDNITGPAADYTYFVRYQGRTAADLGGESVEATVAARGAVAA